MSALAVRIDLGRGLPKVSPTLAPAPQRGEGIMQTHKLIPNWKLESVLAKREPFTNYNQSITAEIDHRGVYTITHWRTTILEYDLETSKILSFYFDYWSQTTSALQGRIVRALLTTENVRELVEQFAKTGQTHNLRRLKGMARFK